MKKKSPLIIYVFFIAILTCVNVSLFSQAGRGLARIAGVVQDESGNPVPDATVIAVFMENEEVTREVKTNKRGEWGIIGLGTGEWKISAFADGYAPTAKTVFIRQLDKNPSVQLTLEKQEGFEGITRDEDAIALLQDANLLFEQKAYDEALAKYKEFLEEHPGVFQVRLSIGSIYNQQENYDMAMEEFRAVLEKAKEDEDNNRKIIARALSGIGECHLLKDEFESAQQYFQQSIELSPDNEVLAYNVGEIFFANQKIDQAITYFQKAIDINPDYSPAYLRMGYAYLNQNKTDPAAENFKKFLELDPDSPEAPTVKNILSYLEK